MPEFDPVKDFGFYRSETMTAAARALGLGDAEVHELFGSSAPGDTVPGFEALRPGTVRYARAGARHIEAFIRRRYGYEGPTLVLPWRAKKERRQRGKR
jgi:hypothetical protein